MAEWCESLYTGLFSRFSRLSAQPYDPAVPIWSGTLPPWGPRTKDLTVGGAGWDEAQARAACVGEALERMQPHPLPCDRAVEASFAEWPLDEPAVAPERWVLFHPEQYRLPEFPFRPFTRATRCRWVCFRRALSGDPCWVPEELAFLFLRAGVTHQFTPGVSTGFSCARSPEEALLRGLQEVIERDAVVGAWWGRYALEEWEAGEVFALLDPGMKTKVLRPNLRYRFYRADAPFSAHVTLVTVEGEDRPGFCFCASSACRATRAESWRKALLEAVQGRPYIRYLKGKLGEEGRVRMGTPVDFPDHAVYYSCFPEKLDATPFRRACPPKETGRTESESLAALAERLGPERPVLFRLMTPPGIAQRVSGICVVKVLVPGVQPLHGNHLLPQLGGSLWAPRGWSEWKAALPHPFA